MHGFQSKGRVEVRVVNGKRPTGIGETLTADDNAGLVSFLFIFTATMQTRSLTPRGLISMQPFTLL